MRAMSLGSEKFGLGWEVQAEPRVQCNAICFSSFFFSLCAA